MFPTEIQKVMQEQTTPCVANDYGNFNSFYRLLRESRSYRDDVDGGGKMQHHGKLQENGMGNGHLNLGRYKYKYKYKYLYKCKYKYEIKY